MIKRILMVVALVAFGAALAVAEPFKGKITTIDGKKVTIELVGEKASWVKKGAPVKFKGGVGRIVGITDGTITFNTKKASELKVGDEIELDKGPATLQGC
jgi:hypothetical protein